MGPGVDELGERVFGEELSDLVDFEMEAADVG